MIYKRNLSFPTQFYCVQGGMKLNAFFTAELVLLEVLEVLEKTFFQVGQIELFLLFSWFQMNKKSEFLPTLKTET